jgi:hypothetical protein
LRPLLFTIIALRFAPQVALESFDSGAPRIDKIVTLIFKSRYAIHDISRIQARNAGDMYRLNMPFELGLDVGSRLRRKGMLAGKRCLILEGERYRYQAALSDMAGSDIKAHGNKPQEVVRHTRDWLNQQERLYAPGPGQIWDNFNAFMAANHARLSSEGYSERDIEQRPVGDLLRDMQELIQSCA